MGICLVTKCKGIVNNDTIHKIGEIKISLGENKGNSFSMLVNGNVTIKSKDGTIDSNNITSTEITGRSDPFKVTENTKLSILNKYDLTDFSIYNNRNDNSANNLSLDVIDFMYCKKLIMLELNGGDNVTGDISFLSNQNMTNLIFNKCKVYGTLTFKKMTNLNHLRIIDTEIDVDLDSLSNCNNLEEVVAVSSLAHGSINNLPKKVKTINVYNTHLVIGDVSKMGSSLNILIRGYFNWKFERDNNYNIITLKDVHLGSDVDAMLINQSKCVVNVNTEKIISVFGNKTSASDAAVQALQSKGYTVSITPE